MLMKAIFANRLFIFHGQMLVYFQYIKKPPFAATAKNSKLQLIFEGTI
jgi:hypothetical protein